MAIPTFCCIVLPAASIPVIPALVLLFQSQLLFSLPDSHPQAIHLSPAYPALPVSTQVSDHFSQHNHPRIVPTDHNPAAL